MIHNPERYDDRHCRSTIGLYGYCDVQCALGYGRSESPDDNGKYIATVADDPATWKNVGGEINPDQRFVCLGYGAVGVQAQARLVSCASFGDRAALTVDEERSLQVSVCKSQHRGWAGVGSGSETVARLCVPKRCDLAGTGTTNYGLGYTLNAASTLALGNYQPRSDTGNVQSVIDHRWPLYSSENYVFPSTYHSHFKSKSEDCEINGYEGYCMYNYRNWRAAKDDWGVSNAARCVETPYGESENQGQAYRPQATSMSFIFFLRKYIKK